MKNKAFNSSESESGLAIAERCFALPVAAKPYIAPVIEVIDIELTQNFLGSDKGNAPLNFDGEEW
ncbi:MAG: hypothetical protein ACOX19_05470 [Fermentimonas sp.]